MKTAGVACDNYKVSTYEKALSEAGFTFETLPGITSGTKLIQVKFNPEQVEELTRLIQSTERNIKKARRK